MTFANGEIVQIPSPIDVHIHLREPGADTETIASGTYAAHKGGYQAVFDMPNNPGVPTWNEERLDEKRAIAQKTTSTDIGFYAGVDLDNPDIDAFPGMVQKASGLKLYMGHTTGNTKEHDLDTARPAIDAWIEQCRSIGRVTPILLHAREEIGHTTADYIADQEYPAHWCHVSTASEAQLATALKDLYPDNFTAGVTPHHLTMTKRNADYQQGWNGARMQPPLGSEYDADALLAAYNRGSLAILETDHAPHSEMAKLKAEADNPLGHTSPEDTTCFGVSGIEFVLPLMTSLVQHELTTMERLVDSLHEQPLRMLRLRERLGTHAMSQTTELLFEPFVIKGSDIVGRSRNTPYIGWTAGAQVINRKAYPRGVVL